MTHRHTNKQTLAIIREMQIISITSYLLGWLLTKRQEMTNVREGMEKGTPSCMLMVIMPISTATAEYGQMCSEKTKSVTPCDTMIYFWVYIKK